MDSCENTEISSVLHNASYAKILARNLKNVVFRTGSGLDISFFFFTYTFFTLEQLHRLSTNFKKLLLI